MVNLDELYSYSKSLKEELVNSVDFNTVNGKDITRLLEKCESKKRNGEILGYMLYQDEDRNLRLDIKLPATADKIMLEVKITNPNIDLDSEIDKIIPEALNEEKLQESIYQLIGYCPNLYAPVIKEASKIVEQIQKNGAINDAIGAIDDAMNSREEVLNIIKKSDPSLQNRFNAFVDKIPKTLCRYIGYCKDPIT